MAAVAEIVLQMDDSGVVTALQRTEGGLTRLGSRGNVIMTGIERSTTRTSAALRTMAGAVGLGNVQFLGMARLGVPGILAAIALAAGTAALRFRSIGDAARSAGEGIQTFADKLRRFLGLGTSDALVYEQIVEEQKLLIPLLEKEAELRRGAASAGLEGFAALREARKQEILQIRELAQKQMELARQQFGTDARDAFGLIGSAEKRAIAAANAKFDAEERALARERAKELEKLRRDSFLTTQQMAVATSEGLAKILNQEVLDLNASLARELELREKYKDDSISLEEERAAIRRRTDQQLAEFRRMNAEETLRMEEQAALASLPPWQQAYAGIITQAQQREREVRAALERTEIEEEDAARRITAIWQEAHAQQRAALVGTLEEFAAGPMEFFQRRWKQMLFQMIADTILASSTLRNIFGSIFGVPLGGPAPSGAGQGGGFGGGSVFGIPGLGGTPPFNPNAFVSGFTGGATSLPGVLGLGATLSGGGAGGGTVLPGGASTVPGGDIFTRIRSSLGLGPLSRAGQIGVGIAGILGGLLSGSGNRGVRALGGALTGGSLGFAVGGPIGAVVGAIIGGLVGLFSGPNFGKQRDRFLRDQFQPAVDRVVDAYNVHQMDYSSAISQLESLREQGVQQLRQLKGDGHRAHQVVDAAIAKINATEAERQRRLNTSFGAPMFHGGGLVGAGHARSNVIPFPSLGAGRMPARAFHSGGEVVARLQPGEFVMQRRAVQQIGVRNLETMNQGGAAAGGVVVNIYPASLDRAWLRNGGAAEVAREIRRAMREGAA